MLKRLRSLFRKADDNDGTETEAVKKPERRAVPAPQPPVHHGPDIVHRPIDEVDLDPDAVKIVQRLTRFDHKAYLVGGCVRDLLLERSPKDFDIATSATPRQIKRLFRNCRIIGRRFRLAHIYFHGGKVIEVATFRALDEGRADADASGDGDLMIRDDNVFGSVEEDALRRDFTVNALFYDMADGTVIDHVNGLEDLRRRVIRTIGEPELRFREDPIRILRAIKFAARLDFEIEPATLAAIGVVAEEIPRAAAPRIIEELHRFFREGSARRAFNLLLDTGVLEVVLPELTHELTAAPARRELVGALLAAADARRATGDEPRMGAMFAALLLPIVTEPFGWNLDGTVNAPKRIVPRTIIERRLRPVVERLRVPRREQEHCRQALMSLARMVPAERVRRATLRSILSRASLDDSMALLAVLADVCGGEFAVALEYWNDAIGRGDVPAGRERQADQRAPTDIDDDDDGASDEEPSARRRRSRGGRGRRGKRSGSGRAEPEASGAKDSGGTSSARRAPSAPSRSMPSPWDDQYFFAALPTVPERAEAGEPATEPAGDAREAPDERTVSPPGANGRDGTDDGTDEGGERPRRRRSRGGRRRRRGGRGRSADASSTADGDDDEPGES